MKRLSAFCASLGLFLMANPMTALAAEQEGGASASSVPLWMCIPFAGLLLCIAILPLVKAEWWEEHQPHAVALWSISFYHSVCDALQCGDSTGNGSGMPGQRLFDLYYFVIWTFLRCRAISPCPVTWQVLRVSMWDYWHWEPCFQAGSVRPVPVC